MSNDLNLIITDIHTDTQMLTCSHTHSHTLTHTYTQIHTNKKRTTDLNRQFTKENFQTTNQPEMLFNVIIYRGAGWGMHVKPQCNTTHSLEQLNKEVGVPSLGKMAGL